MRGVGGVVVNGLVGEVETLLQAQGTAGVGVDIEPGPVAAAEVQADSMALFKDIGCRVELENELISMIVKN